jgi:hypothetical protein
MKIDWKFLSYSMLVSGFIIWVCALFVSVVFIQPLLDSWRCIPSIVSGNTSTTIAISKLPVVPLWGLLLIALMFWCSLTVGSYELLKYLNRNKKRSDYF